MFINKRDDYIFINKQYYTDPKIKNFMRKQPISINILIHQYYFVTKNISYYLIILLMQTYTEQI